MAKKARNKTQRKAATGRAGAQFSMKRFRTEVVPHVPAADVPGLVEDFYRDGAIDVSVVPEGNGLLTMIATFPD